MAGTANLNIDIIVNNAKAKKALADTGDDVEGLATGTEKSSSRMGSAVAGFLGGAAFGAVTKGLGMLKDLVGDSIKAASDLNETTSQVGQIFGSSAPAIEAFAANSAKAFGLSKNAAEGAANTFATFGKAAGLSGDNLVGFSTDMVGLSADLASFKNTTPEEAVTAIGAALRGESEPIRKYGVLLDDATLKARAMRLGLIQNTTEALTPQNKALAAQAEILAQTSDAQGDFAKTSDGLANQQRIASAQWEDMQATLGQALLPVLTRLGGILTDTVLPALQSAAGFVADNVSWLGPLAAAIGVVVLAWKAWTIAEAAFNAVMAANPIVLIVIAVLAAIAALAVAFVWLWNNCETFRTTVTALWENFKAGLAVVVEFLGNAVGWISDAFTWLMGVLQPVFDLLGNLFKVWIGIITTEIDIVVGVFRWLLDFLRPVFDILGALFTTWVSIVTTEIDIIVGIFRWLIGFIGDIVGRIWAIGVGMWNFVSEGVSQIVGWVTDAWNNVIGFISGVGAKLTDAARGMWDGIWNAFKSVINLIINGWNSLKFTIPGFDLGPVHFDGFTLAVPRITPLARGALVSRPTLALVGEAGPELVSPVGTLRRLIAEGAGPAGTTIDARVFNVTVPTSGLGPDSPSIQRDLVEALTRWSARNGPLPASIGR